MPARNRRFGGFWSLCLATAACVSLHASPAFAQVSGTVTSAATSAPVADATVSIYSSTGSLVASTSTDPQGAYSFPGLPASSYFVRAVPPAGSGLEAQLYNGIACPANPSTARCSTANGTPVTVTASNPTPNINFALVPLGTITGVVRKGSSIGEPVAGVTVYFFYWVDLEVQPNPAWALTDADGAYASPGLPSGAYLVSAKPTPASGLIPWSTPEAFPRSVLAGQATVQDFALAIGARITGTVRNAATLAPVANIPITFRQGLHTAGTSLTDSEGVYTSPGLPTGSYHVIANRTSESGLVGQLHDNVACPWGQCTLATGDAVALTSPNVATIDFDLVAGGTITGTVTNALTLAPVAGGSVSVYSSTGQGIASGTTDAEGVYAVPGLPTGSYFVVATAGAAGLVRQLHTNIPCPDSSCDVTSGTPVTVTATNSTTVNFTLSALGAISGTVIEEATGALFAGATVSAFTSDGSVESRFTRTDAQGRYALYGLQTGSYIVRVRPPSDSTLLGEIYDNISCSVPFCPVTSGTPVTVTESSVTPDINVALSQGGTIAGRVINAMTSAPMADAFVSIYSSTGLRVWAISTDAFGNYSAPGLPTGSYFLSASSFSSGQGLMTQVYSGISCPGFGTCSVTSGTPVVVTAPSPTPGINFALSPWASITGAVTSAQSGAPVGATVSVYSSTGAFLTSATTTAQGGFTVNGLLPGSYFVRALPSSSAFVGELYDNIPCPGGACSVTGGTPVATTAATATTINFALVSFGTITGTVTHAITHAPVAGALVFVYGSGGWFVASAGTDTQGVYSLGELATGSYFVVALPSFASGLLPKVYDDIACPVGCPVTSGTPVAVSAPDTRSDINFALSPGATITGIVTHAVTGAPIGSVSVIAYTSDGTQVLTSTQTDAQGAYSLTRLTTGSYFVRATPPDGSDLLRQLYNNINCPLGLPNGVPGGECLITSGTPVTVTQPNATPNINFALTPWATITGTVINAATQAPVVGAVVFSYSSGGSQLRTSMTDAQGAYAITGFSTGSYFLMVAPPASSGLSRQLYDRLPCPLIGIGVCPVTSGTPVAVTTPNATTVNIEMSPAPFGQVDTPVQNAAGVQGAIAVTGWALDDVGVAKVEVWRSCLPFESANCQTVRSDDNIPRTVIYIGDAEFLEGARPDVASAYPGTPNNTRAGWGLLVLTPILPNVPNSQPHGGVGTLSLLAYALDAHGNRKLLGRSSEPSDPGYGDPTSITMSNDTIAKPFGTIDTPAQGETISGVFFNFGWALTPDNNLTGGDGDDILIPINGSTMTVFIDGEPTALVAYNQCRGNVGNPVPGGVYCNDDVASIFGNPTPQPALTARTSNPTTFRNLDAGRGVIGAFTIDTSTLSNGLHTISWSVTDSAGRTEGIGSRFFIVDNPVPTRAVSTPGSFEAIRQTTSAPAVASLLPHATLVTDGLFVRFGFDLAEAWKPLRPHDDGRLAVRLPELGRLELWLGKPVEAGYLAANGTLHPLPVGASLQESRFSWMPPPGYVGPYELVFVRGHERINVTVVVK